MAGEKGREILCRIEMAKGLDECLRADLGQRCGIGGAGIAKDPIHSKPSGAGQSGATKAMTLNRLPIPVGERSVRRSRAASIAPRWSGLDPIATPDLVDRVRRSAPFNSPDPDTFYGEGAKRYTDYPMLEE